MESLYIGLDIENSVGTILKSESASSPNQTVVSNWTCSSTGTYYLVVWEATGYQNTTAYYEITCEMTSGVGIGIFINKDSIRVLRVSGGSLTLHSFSDGALKKPAFFYIDFILLPV